MTTPIQILIVTQSPIPDALVEQVRAVSPRVRVENRVAQSLEALGDIWRDVEVLYTTGVAPAPEAAPALRWVQGHFAGADHFLLQHEQLLHQVVLTTASGVHAPNMAEYILMMMLAWAHHLPRMLEHQKRGEWPQERWDLFAPRELRGGTLGIVGYGSIGRETARLAKVFGMRVLATKRNVQHVAEDGWGLSGVGDPGIENVDQLYPPDALHALLAESDYVALTVPLSPATRGMIGANEFNVMKPEALVINVARGGVIDEAALIEALRSGTIGGAALDVFAQEPLPAESPLWVLPNVILSPHVAGFSPDYDARAMALFAENLRRYLAGETLLNVVELERGY